MIESSVRPTDMMDWKTWLKNGDQYLKAGTPKKRKSRFSSDIQYNLLAMAFESYTMAISDFFNYLPENHTFTDLTRALDLLIAFPQDLKERILRYEDLQSICSVDEYQRSLPDAEGVDDLRDAVAQVGIIAHQICISETDDGHL